MKRTRTLPPRRSRESAGLLLYRLRDGEVEVLLVHPGGPFWQKKDLGSWTIPKGEPTAGEDLTATALREFGEEVGPVPAGQIRPLGRVRQSGGKWVEAFALQGDFDTSTTRCNSFEMEWPPRSGRTQSFTEIDQAAWFTLADARRRLNRAQVPFLETLIRIVRDDSYA